MRPHVLNQVAIWLPMKSEELDVKVYNDYPYSTRAGIIMSASAMKPVIRYAKNYYIEDAKFSLCMISTEKNQSNVEAFLDETAKKIDLSGPIAGFQKTEFYYEP